MKKFKKLKFILPTLVFVPLAASGAVIGSCAKAAEDLGPEAKKVTVYLDDKELKDQTEFDIKTTKKLQLSAKVEPAEARQDVTFEILAQEGTGNIACSATGIIYPNSCVGTITIRAVSKDKKAKSDPIELIFWDSDSIAFELFDVEISPTESIQVAYVTIAADHMKTIEDLCVPSVCTIGGKQYPVNGVGYSGFNGCSNLSYVRFPRNSEDFWYIGAYSFYLCDSIKKISIPDSITIIDNGAFCNCTSLETIELGNNIKYICSHAFENCISLLNIELPESVVYIGDSAFCQCYKITDFFISKNVKTIGESAFANCWDSTITVEEGSKRFKADNRALYSYDNKTEKKTRLISCQYNLKNNQNGYTFEIPDTITRIDARAFEYCENINAIVFPSNSQCVSIGEEAFALCRNLHDCNLPSGIIEIKPSTFSCCWNLLQISIPATVQYIGKHAFYGCDKLESAYFLKEDDLKDEVTWTILNTTVEPIYTKDNFNVNYIDQKDSSTTFAKEMAYMLSSYGHYLDPDNPSLGWAGGYTNCIWTKNSIPIKTTGIGVGTEYVYTGFDSINRAATKFNAIFRFDNKVEQSTNLKLDLVALDGKSILKNETPIDFYGDSGVNRFELEIGSGKLYDIDQVIMKIYKA